MADDNVTAAGSKRKMVPANFDKMSDDQLLSFYQDAKARYEQQLITDPDGKAFMPTTKRTLEGTEKQLRTRGIHPNDVTPNLTPAMEVKDEGDALAAEIASNKGEPLVQTTTEEQQETVQEDLQASAGEAGAEASAETVQDKLLEKGEEIATDKAKEALEKKDTGGTKATKSGVRVRKACTTCFHYSNCSFCPKCPRCPKCC